MTDFTRYGWTVDETNLATLPPTAPKAAKDLTKWLTLNGRRNRLKEWLGCASDGRIHGKFWPIGAWTHRMSHSNPNQANIPSPFHGDPKNPVEEVKKDYDSRMRELWGCDRWLVGTDADAIQLRVLTHYMKSEAYREAILKGNKDDKTDIHSLNQRSLGPICRNRDTAKTFIYAWLLGASTSKVADILECSTPQASVAMDNFLRAIPELAKLKDYTIPRDAMRGYFLGLDGRRVQCDSEHLMLAGYLQNGEAVIMKHANVLWYKWLKAEGIKFKQVDFVHDEWQVETFGSKEEAERVGELQRLALKQVGEDLELFCPLDGSTSIGTNWLETH